MVCDKPTRVTSSAVNSPSPRVIIVIALMAFVVRLAFWHFYPTPPLSSVAVGDYLRPAARIVRGMPFNDESIKELVRMTPLYQYLIAALIQFSPQKAELLAEVDELLEPGHTAASVEIRSGPLVTRLHRQMSFVHVCLDTLSVVFVVLLATAVAGGTAGAIAGSIAAAFPLYWYSNNLLTQEPMFTCGLTAHVYLLVLAFRKRSVVLFAAAGLMLGVATLVKASAQYWPLFLLPVCLFLIAPKLEAVRSYATLVLCYLAVLTPWAIRNYLVFHDFIPVSTAQAGTLLLQGADEQWWYIAGKAKWLPPYLERLKREGKIAKPDDATTKPTQLDHWLTQAAIERFKQRWREEPWSYPRFLALKLARMFWATESGNRQLPVGVCYALLLPFSIAGIWRAAHREQRTWPGWVLLALIGYFMFFTWIVTPIARYILPVTFCFIVFAAYKKTS
jgi:hypothetical protein